MNTRSPFGRKPLRASAAIATARVAVWFFMSTAPRPHSQPSASRWPANGGYVQSGSSAGTTSVWPHSASDGPSPVPGIRATRFGRSISRAASSHWMPAASRYARSRCAAGASFPGGLPVSMRIRSAVSSVASRRIAASSMPVAYGR